MGPQLRREARSRLQRHIRDERPDFVFGHSLGSLICYDLFAEAPDAASGRIFVSLGSQIGNPFVMGQFAGGVRPLPADALWIHLYNAYDRIFTTELRLDREGATNFRQFLVPFNDGLLDSHTDVRKYLTAPQAPEAFATAQQWRATRGARREIAAVDAARDLRVTSSQYAPQRPRRALLIGINHYQKPSIPTLAGCENDVFLVSSVLQERGFDPNEIRVVLNDRATNQGLRDRLDWLFDDVRDGDVRFLFFSGHGVRLPAYDAEGEPDRLIEALVPHDFDGSRALAITDRDLASYYHRLPPDARLIMAFDCCHSGGLSRSSGDRTSRRTFDLPDDIRHRMLRWEPEERMWVERRFEPLIPSSGNSVKKGRDWIKDYVGDAGVTERLGRSVVRRRVDDADFDDLCRSTSWRGPYLPMILEACREEESAEEYLHGSASYGVFTYALCDVLRYASHPLTFEQLVKETSKKIERLNYVQHPTVVGPTKLLKLRVPFLNDAAAATAPRRRRTNRRPAAKRPRR